MPSNPDEWLIVVARNLLRNSARARKTRETIAQSLLVLTPIEAEEMPKIANKRLELMFVCGHTAIDAAARAADVANRSGADGRAHCIVIFRFP